MAVLGYARVSSTDQSLDVQLEQLAAAGCEKVFQEKKSGKSTDGRTELEALLGFCREGDVIIVCRLDRLARSMADFCSMVRLLSEKKVGLKVLNQPIDTTNATGEFTAMILMAVAQLELSLRSERQKEGIAKAKEDGRYGKGASRTSAALKKKLMNLHKKFPQATPKQLAIAAGCSARSVYRHVPDIAGEMPAHLIAHREKMKAGGSDSELNGRLEAAEA